MSPAGVVTEVPPAPVDASELFAEPSLSPDGRWLARGPVLTDLVSGAAVPSAREQARAGAGLDAAGAAHRGGLPTRSRVFVGTFNQGQPRFAGIVVGIDGSVTSVPLVEDGLHPGVRRLARRPTLSWRSLDVGPDDGPARGSYLVDR